VTAYVWPTFCESRYTHLVKTRRKRSWLERGEKELFEHIRREYEFGVGTIQGVAKKFGVHRRMAREALRNALPGEAKPPDAQPWKFGQAVPFIDHILEQDREVPRKQRHTACRLW
jgi:hypothetical protein